MIDDRIVDAIAQFTLIGVDPDSVVGGEYERDFTIGDIVAAIEVLGGRSWALSVIFANISADEFKAILARLSREQIEQLQLVNERFGPDIRVKQAMLDEMVRAAEGRE